MIVFHEGLPGSGKSYEACVFHILPALKAGRRVVTNIEGIDHAKFADLSGIPLPVVKKMLICIYDPDIEVQKERILAESGKDALVIIDEIQNLFPSERAKLSDLWNHYITEHRHDGLDILLMGQDRRDCHSMWRRRIQRVITFNKLSAVGLDKKYRWVCYEATHPEKFKKTTGGTRSYDPTYYGCYKSHTDGTENKSVYADKRATVFADKKLRFAALALPMVLYFAGSTIYDFFTDAEPVQPVTQAPKARTVSTAPAKLEKPSPAKQVQSTEPPPEPPPIDMFDELAQRNRLRLSAYVQSEKDPEKLYVQVDVLDARYHVQDSFDLAAIRDLGWKVTYRPSGLHLSKANKTHIARAWPIDKPGRVDNDTRASL
ncbi:zonular occludens toxin family protein [Spongiibacter tropicus]|uniref:zonular occludens toxin family protein n=1 Tax=Spongiibacter tropicus TaxID=454602 RepID=UPI0003B65C38|nr:zonular occludens toxin domain-containing protein [Spongiibacter tropicus]